jgi:hypothetical protein
VLRLRLYFVTTIIVRVFGGKPAAEDAVVIPLVKDEDAIMSELGIELGKRLAPVALRAMPLSELRLFRARPE